MYLNYFGLDKAPFGITPDTSLFFDGADRGEVLQALLYALNSGEGIIKVVGEVGSGKTILSRMLAKQLPDSVVLVFLLNPNIMAEQVLYAIAYDLGLDISSDHSSIQVLHLLQKKLLELYNEGKKVVLVIDEAQQMPLATLEEIRLLSNLETETEKLLQIVLFGQPELDSHIDTPKIRQLRERITYSFYLNPLTSQSAQQYLEFRLQKAGNRGRSIFTPSSIKLLSKLSGGTLRRLNLLADKALLAAFLKKSATVEPAHVRLAFKDTMKDHKQKTLPFWAIASGLLLLGVATLALWHTQAPEVMGTSHTVIATAEHSENKGPQNHEVNAVLPKRTESTAVVETPITPIQAIAKPISEQGATTNADLLPLVEQRMQAFKVWKSQSENHYTIRLLSAVGGAAQSVESFLESAQRNGLIDDLYVTTLNTENNDYVVYYKNYIGYSKARSDLAALPKSLKKFGPYISQVPN